MNVDLEWRIKACVVCVALLAIPVSTGCNGRSMGVQLAEYKAIHKSAAIGLPLAVQIEELFPGMTDHFITHFGMARNAGQETLTWNSVAYFGDRFEMQMQVPVIVDYDNRTVTRAGKPVFGLMEHTRVEDDDGVIVSHSGNGAVFGEAEWNRIYDSGGDFSIVNVDTDNAVPLPGFKKIVEAERRPRLPITLLPKNRAL